MNHAQNPLAFAWPVDQQGYDIVRRTAPDPAMAALWGAQEIEDIVPRGGEPRWYRPLDYDGLWLRFAVNCNDADTLLEFTNEFGLTGHRIGGFGGGNFDEMLSEQRGYTWGFVKSSVDTAFVLKQIW